MVTAGIDLVRIWRAKIFMNFEYQALYRQRDVGSDLKAIVIIARGEDEVREVFGSLPDLVLVRVQEVRPILDWNQQVFKRDEAAAFLRIGLSSLDAAMARGDLPKARNGDPRFFPAGSGCLRR
jgi:hypothetical protein